MIGTPGPDIERDADLARRFRAERTHDERAVPGFARVLARREPAARRRWLQPAAVIAAAAAVIFAGERWRRAETGPSHPFVVVPGDLRVPTDYLLDIAGATMSAGEVPSIGAIDWYPLAGSAGTAPATSSRRN